MTAESNPTPSRPKISVIILSYNHARFAGEAVVAILAQSILPDELVLCDDGSTDDSRTVLAEVAELFPASVKVLKIFNDHNVGFAPMLNRAFAAAQGELWVLQAADDISHPQRIERVVEAYVRSAGKVRAVCSNAQIVDASGCAHGDYFPREDDHRHNLATLSEGFNGVLGATATYHRDVWDVFGPLPTAIFQEDVLLPFRASILGEVHYIPEPLVKYRFHGSNMNFAGQERLSMKAFLATRWKVPSILRNRVGIASQRVQDLKLAQKLELLSPTKNEEAAKACAACFRDSVLELEVFGAPTFTVLKKLASGYIAGTSATRCVRIGAYCLSPTLHVFLLRIWIKIGDARRFLRRLSKAARQKRGKS